jgi:hypothetical protein
MEFGYTESLIRIDQPTHLAGYGSRLATGIHDELTIHTLAIQVGLETIVLNVVDVIMISTPLALRIKHAIAAATGLPLQNIFTTAIHTHSAPIVSSFLPEDGKPDPGFIASLITSLVENSQYVLEHLHRGTLFTKTDVIANGWYSNRNGKDLPYNNHVYQLQFRLPSGQPIVTILSMACHPTILHEDNYLVSADYVGRLREDYRHKYHCGCIFTLSEAGDVSTRLTKQGKDFTEIKRFSDGIINQLTDTQWSEITPSTLAIHELPFVIDYSPKQETYLTEKLSALKDKETSIHDPHQLSYFRMRFLGDVLHKLSQTHIHYESSASTIEFDTFRIITWPSEMVTALATPLRHLQDKPLLLLCYTNGFNGYAVDNAEYGRYFESFITNFPKGRADEVVRNLVSTIHDYSK